MFGGFRGVSAYDLNQETEIDNSIFNSQGPSRQRSHLWAEKEIKITSFYEKDPKTLTFGPNETMTSEHQKFAEHFLKHRNSCELIKEWTSNKTTIDEGVENYKDKVYRVESRRTSISLQPITIPDGEFESKHPLNNNDYQTPPASILRKNKLNTSSSKMSSQGPPIAPPRVKKLQKKLANQSLAEEHETNKEKNIDTNFSLITLSSKSPQIPDPDYDAEDGCPQRHSKA